MRYNLLLTKTFFIYLIYRVLNIVSFILCIYLLFITKEENYTMSYMLFILSILFFLQYTTIEPEPISVCCLNSSGYFIKSFISFCFITTLSLTIFMIINGVENLQIDFLSFCIIYFLLLTSGIGTYLYNCNKYITNIR